jgi:hypothetical protein
VYFCRPASESHGFVDIGNRLGAFAGNLDVEADPDADATVRETVPLP